MGGYIAFEKALFDMDGAAICREISDSGLRGRGAAAVPRRTQVGRVCAGT